MVRSCGARCHMAPFAVVPQADDEEALKEEEAEVLRLQREQAAALKASDYGLDDDDATDDESDDEGETDEEDDTMAAAAERAGRAGPAAARAHGGGDGDDEPGALQPKVEAVAKDLGGLTEEERMGVLMADAPELVALLGELKGSLEEVSSACVVLCCVAASGCGCWRSNSRHVRLLCSMLISMSKLSTLQVVHAARCQVRLCISSTLDAANAAAASVIWMNNSLTACFRPARCATVWAHCCERCARASWRQQRACPTWRPSTCCCCTTACASCSTSC